MLPGCVRSLEAGNKISECLSKPLGFALTRDTAQYWRLIASLGLLMPAPITTLKAHGGVRQNHAATDLTVGSESGRLGYLVADARSANFFIFSVKTTTGSTGANL